MSNEEAAKLLVELYGRYRKSCEDNDGKYAEAIAMGAAALIYSKEVKPNVNTSWNSGGNMR